MCVCIYIYIYRYTDTYIFLFLSSLYDPPSLPLAASRRRLCRSISFLSLC